MKDDFERGAWAMVDFIYNTSGIRFAELVFPDGHPAYLEEKADSWARSPARAMGYLDDAHRERLFEAVRQHAKGNGILADD